MKGETDEEMNSYAKCIVSGPQKNNLIDDLLFVFRVLRIVSVLGYHFRAVVSKRDIVHFAF